MRTRKSFLYFAFILLAVSTPTIAKDVNVSGNVWGDGTRINMVGVAVYRDDNEPSQRPY